MQEYQNLLDSATKYLTCGITPELRKQIIEEYFDWCSISAPDIGQSLDSESVMVLLEYLRSLKGDIKQ